MIRLILPRLTNYELAGSAVIFMAPLRQPTVATPGAVELCIDGQCSQIDTYQLYLEAECRSGEFCRTVTAANANTYLRWVIGHSSISDPILMFSTQGLDYTKAHTIQITLIEENPELDREDRDNFRGITIDRVEYTQISSPPPPPPPPRSPRPPPTKPYVLFYLLRLDSAIHICQSFADSKTLLIFTCVLQK